MTDRAWYLGCRKHEIADRIILIGDPARVPRLSEHLNNARLLPVNRGLATATGEFNGERVTLAAFGMGAPIAAIILHELSALGASVFLRIGTCMCLPPVQLADFVIAEKALSFEGTSSAYAQDAIEPVADSMLVENIANLSAGRVDALHTGLFASFDGFYRDMFPLDDQARERVNRNFISLQEEGVLAVDMETSALLTVGAALGRRVSSFCVASVDSATQKKLDADEMAKCEQTLAEIALDAISKTPVSASTPPATPA